MKKHPDVPVLDELCGGFEVTTFLGVSVARGTPVTSQEKLNKLINSAITSEPMHSKIDGFGFVTKPMNIRECVEFGRAERGKWEKYIYTANTEAK